MEQPSLPPLASIFPHSSSPKAHLPLPKAVPARGPDGYYRIPSVAAPPPSTSVFHPSNQSHPPINVAPTSAASSTVAVGGAVRAPAANGPAPRPTVPINGEGAGATNPVIGRRTHSSSFKRPADGHIAGMDGGGEDGARLRVGTEHSPRGMQERHARAGGKGALNDRLPESTTPTGSPPRHGVNGGWSSTHPSALPVPTEMETRPYRMPSSSSRPKSRSKRAPPQDASQSPPREIVHADERGPEPDRPAAPRRGRLSDSDAVASSDSQHGPHPQHRSASQRSIPYRREAPAPQSRAVLPVVSMPRETSAESGPSRAAVDYGGDAIMRDAQEGLVQEQRRSLRGRAARSGQAADAREVVGGVGSEMSVVAGVNASGKGVRVGGTMKIGTGPGGVQRKKQRGDQNAPNQDFCSSCRGVGRFLCCDGCPRSFHFMCLEPPLRVDELPDEESWFCKKCRDDLANESGAPAIKRQPSPSPFTATASSTGPPSKTVLKPIPMMFRLMDKRLDEENPVQFRLPENVRSYFAGVAEYTTGAYFEDMGNRKSDKKYDDRDLVLRTKDAKNGRHVACYVCGGSNIPVRTLASDPDPIWRPIVSCDYCSLHWHLDCLNPPLAIVPNAPGGKKWMCPNHAEQVMPKRRTVASGVEVVEVTDLSTPNNGNIEVIPVRPKPQVEYEDIIVNKRKYRVPEQIIQLDFFDRIKGRTRPPPPEKRRRSGSDSSLTSLAEISGSTTIHDVEAANLIMGLSCPSSRRSDGDPPVLETSQPTTAVSERSGGSQTTAAARPRAKYSADTVEDDAIEIDDERESCSPDPVASVMRAQQPPTVGRPQLGGLTRTPDGSGLAAGRRSVTEPSRSSSARAASTTQPAKPRTGTAKRGRPAKGISSLMSDSPLAAVRKSASYPRAFTAGAGAGSGRGKGKGKGKEMPNGRTPITHLLRQSPVAAELDSEGEGDGSGVESEFDDSPGTRRGPGPKAPTASTVSAKKTPRTTSKPTPSVFATPGSAIPAPPLGMTSRTPTAPPADRTSRTPRSTTPSSSKAPAAEVLATPIIPAGVPTVLTPAGLIADPPRIKLSVAKAIAAEAKAARENGVEPLPRSTPGPGVNPLEKEKKKPRHY